MNRLCWIEGVYSWADGVRRIGSKLMYTSVVPKEIIVFDSAHTSDRHAKLQHRAQSNKGVFSSRNFLGSATIASLFLFDN